ncbi:cyclase family protein [Gloeocapsopsis dulcis]|uniref:Cyclase n=1 Tax=Gloeocapsopsis dulcis AAB1 = 1H9 TaxID=1433147 RepID=A0A6N8FZP5_9CHRO|nr:cyclase family protein [Gloeocapsopsis dulcis]MUL38431.1 cyclase [Gloeocapsopsis dulcis AAB1 = 1H9]WNN89747.1 cyclase family protein [Gloeocapsopsis dulcis]
MILDTAKSYLLTEVAPLANEIDTNPNILLKALKGLGNLGLLALRVPQQWAGYGVSDVTFASFQELVARYSGALAFLQTQHQSAAGMLIQSRNFALQQAYLPRMSKGDVLLGVGFSHIRRLGDPTTVAIPVAGGYQIDGFVPWVTGWNLFAEFIVAATLPDGGAVFGIVPFVETQQATGGAIAFSTPMQLAAMRSTNTVSATLTRFFLSSDRVVFIKPAGWIHANDIKNVLRATPLAIGCAMAGLDIVQAAAQAKSLAFIDEAFTALDSELRECRDAIAQVQHSNTDFIQKVQLRAWAIDLAVRTAHAAVTVSSSSANYTDHPAQRVYREALVFTVSGQTPAIMEATLKQLTSPQRYYPKKSQNITYSQVIHLSHVIHPNIPQWLGDPPVQFETVAELDNDGYYLRRFSLGEHTATHINAPKSFYADGLGIDQYPADLLVVPAVVLNIQAQAANPDYTLSVADILAWEQQHGEISPGCVVLLYTSWQNKWWDKAAFLNADASGNLHFPGFSSDATQFLLQRQIAGVGIDTHGVDPGQDPSFATNRLVLEKSRIVLENLTNLDQLPVRGATLVIGILRLQDGSGSPAAVMALVP